LSKEKELQDLQINRQGQVLEKQVLEAKTREQKLRFAEIEKSLRDKEIKNQKLVRNLLLAVLALVLSLGAISFNRYQLGKKLEQQKGLLAMRSHISQDLHDDIGASLSNINILNELAKRNLTQPEKSREYLAKASEDIQRISESLSDIVWNINPRYDDAESLFIRMKRYAADMFDARNIIGQFTFPDEIKNMNITMAQRRDLYLIFKEAVNNLVKYSGAANAVIQISMAGKTISMLVKDDGKGFDAASAEKGNGLRNMRQRAQASGAEISIKSQMGKGTEIYLQLYYS
jgi:signal transduction histidine kinase